MPRDDKPYEPWVWFPYRILETLGPVWFFVLAVVGAIAGSIYAHYHGYKVLQGLVLGAVVGFLFLPLLAKIVELSVAAAIIGGIGAIVYYVFIKK